MSIRLIRLTTPLGKNHIFNFAHQGFCKRSHSRFYFIQLRGFIARCKTETHRLQVDAFIVMRAGDGKGLGDPSVKGILLKLAHPRHNICGTGRK